MWECVVLCGQTAVLAVLVSGQSVSQSVSSLVGKGECNGTMQ